MVGASKAGEVGDTCIPSGVAELCDFTAGAISRTSAGIKIEFFIKSKQEKDMPERRKTSNYRRWLKV
jgi:hypothetical protein